MLHPLPSILFLSPRDTTLKANHKNITDFSEDRGNNDKQKDMTTRKKKLQLVIQKKETERKRPYSKRLANIDVSYYVYLSSLVSRGLV